MEGCNMEGSNMNQKKGSNSKKLKISLIVGGVIALLAALHWISAIALPFIRELHGFAP